MVSCSLLEQLGLLNCLRGVHDTASWVGSCSLLGSGLGYVVLCPFPPGLVRGMKGIGGGCGNERWGGWTKQCSFSIYMKSRSSTTSFVKLARCLEAEEGTFLCWVVARRAYTHGRNCDKIYARAYK